LTFHSCAVLMSVLLLWGYPFTRLSLRSISRRRLKCNSLNSLDLTIAGSISRRAVVHDGTNLLLAILALFSTPRQLPSSSMLRCLPPGLRNWCIRGSPTGHRPTPKKLRTRVARKAYPVGLICQLALSLSVFPAISRCASEFKSSYMVNHSLHSVQICISSYVWDYFKSVSLPTSGITFKSSAVL
jgi:hypothetical protein